MEDKFSWKEKFKEANKRDGRERRREGGRKEGICSYWEIGEGKANKKEKPGVPIVSQW